ncbi:MAG: RdgB/HAM1 family non-canonical purine NTP pyrophosphatase [Chitinophagaceae bacterium]
MRELIFATHNPNKVVEIRSLLVGNIHIISLDEAGMHEDIPEPHDTIEANAREKSSVIYRLTGKNCFGEDTGLEVASLHGAPGVHSARYAGPQKSASDNIDLLLKNMQGVTDRKARFKTVISLILSGKEHQFKGICEGIILLSPRGKNGFGYDPVFVPDGGNKTFAEMDLDEKNKYSHRAKAFEMLNVFLKEIR